MEENNNGNEQVINQENTTIMLNTELDASSNEEYNHNDSHNIGNPSLELVSINSDDGANTNTENKIMSYTNIDHYQLVFNELRTSIDTENDENGSSQYINQDEAFNEQNVDIQTHTAAEQTEADHSNDEYDESDSDTSNNYETDENCENDTILHPNVLKKVLVTESVTESVTNQMELNISSMNIFETNDQHHYQITHETTTARSDYMVPPHQSDEPKAAVTPKPTAKREKAIDLLDHRVTDILQNDHYNSEVAYVQKNIAFNILLIGAPRIGKSALVNALTGNKENLAETSARLESCTVKHDKYELKCQSLDDAPRDRKCKVFIWDTKGIEDWDKQSGMNTMFQLINEIQPICVIFCASPGSFANLTQVKMVLDYCNWRKILCAAVLTNMWGGSKEARASAMADLRELFSRFGQQEDWKFSNPDPNLPQHIVHVFGDKGLCTMVNSEPFAPEFTTNIMPVRGIDELTHCIMQLLSEEQLQGWCQAVLGNRSFFQKIHQQTNGFVLKRWSFLRHLAAAVVDNMENKTKRFGANFFDFFDKLVQ